MITNIYPGMKVREVGVHETLSVVRVIPGATIPTVLLSNIYTGARRWLPATALIPITYTLQDFN